MCIFFRGGIARPGVIKARHSDLWCRVREMSKESIINTEIKKLIIYLAQEPLAMFWSCWSHFIPARKDLVLNKKVRTTSVLRRLHALIVGAQPGVEELLDVDLPHSAANQALLRRQSAPGSKKFSGLKLPPGPKYTSFLECGFFDNNSQTCIAHSRVFP